MYHPMQKVSKASDARMEKEMKLSIGTTAIFSAEILGWLSKVTDHYYKEEDSYCDISIGFN
jgi:hypothetical protein